MMLRNMERHPKANSLSTMFILNVDMLCLYTICKHSTYYFIINFYVNYPITTKFLEIILGLIIIVFTTVSCTA